METSEQNQPADTAHSAGSPETGPDPVGRLAVIGPDPGRVGLRYRQSQDDEMGNFEAGYSNQCL